MDTDRTYTSKLSLGILSLSVLVIAVPSQAANLSCATSNTLEALTTCIRDQMPPRDSNEFVVPSATEQADWRMVVREMLQGQCAIALPIRLDGIVQIRTLVDTDNNRGYCVLMETLDANNNGYVDRGFGTVIVNPAALRNLSHQAAHPSSDSMTEIQAVSLFKQMEAASFVMAGAHRNANTAPSPCQNDETLSDVAHNVDNMFHATNQEFADFYGSLPWHAIQWHGMAAETCPNADVYPTHGLNQPLLQDDILITLHDNLSILQPAWRIGLPGTGACGLTGTTNTQGRLLNGVAPANVCDTNATSTDGTFIHIEQAPGFRTSADWLPALNATWPIDLPAAPTGLTAAVSSGSTITLNWQDNSGNETGFVIERAIGSTTTFTAIATITANIVSFTDTELNSGILYSYRIRATSAGGVSAPSNVAGATISAVASLYAVDFVYNNKAGESYFSGSANGQAPMDDLNTSAEENLLAVESGPKAWWEIAFADASAGNPAKTIVKLQYRPEPDWVGTITAEYWNGSKKLASITLPQSGGAGVRPLTNYDWNVSSVVTSLSRLNGGKVRIINRSNNAKKLWLSFSRMDVNF